MLEAVKGGGWKSSRLVWAGKFRPLYTPRIHLHPKSTLCESQAPALHNPLRPHALNRMNLTVKMVEHRGCGWLFGLLQASQRAPLKYTLPLGHKGA